MPHTPEVPFKGCDRLMTFREDEEPLFQRAVAHLMACDHPHNFMVAKDGRKIYLSKMATVCVSKVVDPNSG